MAWGRRVEFIQHIKQKIMEMKPKPMEDPAEERTGVHTSATESSTEANVGMCEKCGHEHKMDGTCECGCGK